MSSTSTVVLRALAGVASALATTGAAAQFTASAAGPLPSPGGSFGATYTGPATLFDTLEISGTLTALNPATFASESELDFFVNGDIAAFLAPFVGVDTFDAPLDVALGVGVLFFADPGDSVLFQTFEFFDDGADGEADAEWTNLSAEFSTSGLADLGTFNPGTFDLNTFGSDFDTEIGLYSADGTLIATNDDSGSLQSQILVDLDPGEYIVSVGAFNSLFVDGFAIGGNVDSGEFTLSLGVEPIVTGTINPFDLFSASFTVVPTPGVAAVFAFAGVTAARRRR